MRIQRLIASVAQELREKRGEPDVLILRQDKLRNRYVAKIRSLEAVAKACRFRPLLIQKLFDLPRNLAEASFINRVLRRPLARNTEKGAPRRAAQPRIGVCEGGALVQLRIQQSDGGSLCAPSHISPRVLENKSRPVKTLLTGTELFP